jgi:anaerobic ribonucleoside-triphosphate reductase
MDRCAVCGKQLGDKQGMISSTGVIVCSKECKDKFSKTLPNEGKGALEIYSRVTGYYTPVKSWNKGKLKEFAERRRYEIG